MSTDTQEFDELLSKLQEQHDTSQLDIYLPSDSKTVKSKKITVDQQSLILAGAITQETRQNVFSYNRVISEIILKNCSDPENINLIDKIPLAIQYRIDTIGDTMDLNGDTIQLTDHLQSVYQLVEPKLQGILESHEHITDTGVTIVYSCPPLFIDYDVNSSAEKKWSSLQGEDIISELFKVEMSKYIQQVSFQEEVIPVMELDFESRMKVCNILPMSCSKVLVEFIESVKSVESLYVSVSGNDIPMDATLFGS
jgi:hypothetical protein